MHVYIQWDETKRRENLRQHGIDFAELEGFFAGDLLTREDTRFLYAETRFQSIGLHEGVALFVVWAPVEIDDSATHIISARNATKHETQAWFQHYSARH